MTPVGGEGAAAPAWSGPSRYRAMVCVVLAVGFHVAAIVWSVLHAPPGLDEVRRQPGPLVTRRIVPVEPPAEATAATPAESPDVAPVSATPSPVREDPPLVPAPVVPLPPPVDVPAEEGARPGSSTDYFPRDQLSRGPVARTGVLMPYPAFPDDAGRYEVRLTLFVDETGVVKEVRIDTPGVPEPIAESARRGFMATPFTPGERDGVPVKAQMHIQVTFEHDTPP